MTAVPPEVFRRWIMVAVLTERPELGDDGAEAVADRLLAGEVGGLAAKVAAVEALAADWAKKCPPDDWPETGGMEDAVIADCGRAIRAALDGATT